MYFVKNRGGFPEAPSPLGSIGLKDDADDRQSIFTADETHRQCYSICLYSAVYSQ